MVCARSTTETTRKEGERCTQQEKNLKKKKNLAGTGPAYFVYFLNFKWMNYGAVYSSKVQLVGEANFSVRRLFLFSFLYFFFASLYALLFGTASERKR